MKSRKRFGQHFLEPTWADKLVNAIQPRPDDRFLEIGPGPGALTLRLAPRAAHVTAVEIDRDIAAALAPKLPPNVDLIQADILEFDFAPLFAAAPIRVAGNLPYNISSPILFRLIEVARARSFRLKAEATRPENGVATRIIDATLMLQREVADRIAAVPGTGDYGVLSICIQLHADVERVLTLPPGAFRPPPRVHSAVVRLTFRPPVVALRDERVFQNMIRAMFTQRRKTVGNALASFADARQMNARAALTAVAIDVSRRPETLQLTELARLADYFTVN